MLLWSLLGVGYYLLAVAVYAALLYLLSLISASLASVLWMGAVLMPVVAYVVSSLWLDPERVDERKGLGIALALFYGLSCLIPLVICGGMILGLGRSHAFH